jgi:hypothetical protein
LKNPQRSTGVSVYAGRTGAITRSFKAVKVREYRNHRNWFMGHTGATGERLAPDNSGSLRSILAMAVFVVLLLLAFVVLAWTRLGSLMAIFGIGALLLVGLALDRSDRSHCR